VDPGSDEVESGVYSWVAVDVQAVQGMNGWEVDLWESWVLLGQLDQSIALGAGNVHSTNDLSFTCSARESRTKAYTGWILRASVTARQRDV
jgi:hypothetical protein